MLENKRILLRNFEESDLDDFYKLTSSKKISIMSGWYYLEDKSSAKFLLQKIKQNPLHFAILLKENGKLIGSIEIMDYDKELYFGIDIQEGAKEIAFLLAEEYWGKGIMKEAIEIILNYAFNTLKIPQILSGNDKENIQSHKLQDKLKIKIVGETDKYKILMQKHTKYFQRAITFEEYNNIKQ